MNIFKFERPTDEEMEQLAFKRYQDDRKYPENFSNWCNCIKDYGSFAHARIINNQVLTFEEMKEFEKTDNINKVDWERLNEILEPTLDKMEPGIKYSIKNGCFSNKFEFDTCVATKDNLAEQFWKINYMSCMFSAGGNTELVVREYIKELKDETLTIYNGMPLRTEARVFYNMNTKQIEYIVDYWDYNYCHNNLHTFNDKVIFDIFHNKTNVPVTNHEVEFNKLCKYIETNIDTLQIEGLEGIWSIDFMYNKYNNIVYLIDMARGFRSAYWNENKIKEVR